MTQKGIILLTKEHFNMTQALKKGYPNLKEKLEEKFYGRSQEVLETKTIIAEYDKRQASENPKQRDKIPRQSNRVFGGRKDIVIQYPKSGKEYEATIRSKKNMVAIEPIQPNRAFWLVDRAFIENKEIIDLRRILHERWIHNKRGKEIMSDFR